MRLQLDLDSDPADTGRKARWWALVMLWLTIILGELALLGLVAVAILYG